MNKKIIKLVKWFLLISLIFSSLFLFNYSYFKANNGLFFLNALDSAGGKIGNYISFDVDSLTWVLFRPSYLKVHDHLGIIKTYYEYRIPYTDPIYFDNGKRDGCAIDFWYLNLKDCPANPNGKSFFESNSAIVFYYVLTPDDYKIIDSFQNTKKIPYLKSIALEIKTLPKFLKSELNHWETDDTQSLLLQIPMLLFTVIFSIPYLYIQVFVPSSLSISFFWLWIVFSVFYIVTPYSVLQKISDRIKKIFKREELKS